MIAARSIDGPAYPNMIEEMTRELNNIIEFTIIYVPEVDNPGFWDHGMMPMQPQSDNAEGVVRLRTLARAEALMRALALAGRAQAAALQEARVQAQKVVARAWECAWEG